MQRLLLTIALLFTGVPLAQAQSCPLAVQKPMLIAQLYFGQDVAGHGRVSAKAWNLFLRQTVTPQFPDGFTVFDAYGQWQDSSRHRIVREPSKVVSIALADTADARRGLESVANAYREKFHQQSVGLVTTEGCGAF
jgi:hypothetical protein